MAGAQGILDTLVFELTELHGQKHSLEAHQIPTDESVDL
jgi:hypothetical protein